MKPVAKKAGPVYNLQNWSIAAIAMYLYCTLTTVQQSRIVEYIYVAIAIAQAGVSVCMHTVINKCCIRFPKKKNSTCYYLSFTFSSAGKF